MVVKLEVVNDKGDLVTYSRADDGEEFMNAVTTNLGLFGFVYKMTLAVKQNKITVETHNEYHSVKDTLTNSSKLKVR